MRERHPKYEIFRESTEPKITELLVPAPEEPKNDFSSPLGFLNQLIELGKFQQELKEFDHLGLKMLSYESLNFPKKCLKSILVAWTQLLHIDFTKICSFTLFY